MHGFVNSRPNFYEATSIAQGIQWSCLLDDPAQFSDEGQSIQSAIHDLVEVQGMSSNQIG